MKPVALYSTCVSCGGHGRIPDPADGPRTRICPKCRGMGFTTTDEGRAIIGLVEAARMGRLLPEAGV